MHVPLTIRVFGDAKGLARAAARSIMESINRARGERESCSVALAGGETPGAVYALLAAEEFRNRVDWNRVHLFFGDERLVPPDDPRSNFGMVRHEMLSHVPIPPENISRIRGEMPPGDAVEEYRGQLKAYFRDGIPRFDLVLLGLGGDGHTASIFPNSGVMEETREIAALVFAPGVKEPRATLTLPVINNAREVMFLVSGLSKASIVREILEAGRKTARLPATMVHPLSGSLRWMIDSDAASQIAEKVRTFSDTQQRRISE